MKLNEFIAAIECRIPKCWAEEWDNPGLAYGDETAEISRVAVALDATEDTVSRAATAGCQLLFTHHPLIFRPLKHIYESVPPQKTLITAIQKNIALYAAHTNWDASPEGVNVILAEKLGLKNIARLEIPSAEGSFGIGAVGNFENQTTVKEIAEFLREAWGCRYLTLFGGADRKISRVALGGGACGSMWQLALERKAELFITADISYHDRNEALYKGLSLIIADHGEMERAPLAKLCDVIREQTSVEVVQLPEEYVERTVL